MNATPPIDDTTPTDEWDTIEAARNHLAKALKQHDGGKDVSAQKIVADLLTLVAKQHTATDSRIDIASKLIDYDAYIAERKGTVGTGIAMLDMVLGGGLEAKRLMVLLGAPGGGKTTLANQIAVHAADSGRPVLYVTSEDMPVNLLSKTISRQGKINYTAVTRGYEDQQARIKATLQEYRESLAGERLHYLDATMQIDMETIKASARAHFEQYKEHGSGILVIDYLQRLARASSAYKSGGTDLRLAVTAFSEELRSIASGLDCCVLCLASQNRASGYGAGSNSLSSAKESGDIEYTADVMMSIGDDLDRVSAFEPKVLKIDKNRQGSTGYVQLDWIAAHQTFSSAEKKESNDSQNPPAQTTGTDRRRKRAR